MGDRIRDEGMDGVGGSVEKGVSAWLEELLRRGDVRVHDSSQAGELVSRLGARAFTVGRDVYVRPELLRAKTPESRALLAHELWHVAEQTGLSLPDLPLRLPPAPVSQANHRSGEGGGGSAGTSARGGNNGTGVPVQREATAGLSSSEVSAEAVERAARSEQSRQPRRRGGAPPPDLEEIADQVYRLIVQDLLIDRERAAYGW